MRRSRWAGGALETILDAIPPASGAVVMGTGIVSIAVWALVATGLARASARALGHTLERQASSGRPT
jgi:hypothetical protein